MTIRAPTFLSKSRPSSPNRLDRTPSNDFDTQNASLPTRRPLSRLQNPFKRSSSASPAPSGNSGFTPLESASPLPGVGAQYLDSIGLKFADAASKALANPIGPVVVSANGASPASSTIHDPCIQLLKGRKPFPPGRGAVLGSLITSELGRSGDVHLSRAIIRTLQRPLSVLLNNLSGILMPILPYVTSTASQVASSGSVSLIAQAHAIGIARLAAELLAALNSVNSAIVLGAGGVDNLRGIRDGLEILVKRVVSPLVSSVKLELGPILDMLTSTPLLDTDSQTPTALPSLAAALPGITTRLEWYTSPPGSVAQSAHAALLIGLVWRALLALSSRPLADPFSSPILATIKKPGSREGMKEAAAKERTTPPGLKSKKELPFVNAFSHMSASRQPSTASFTLANSVASNASSSSASGAIAAPTHTPPRTPPATPRFGRLPLPLTTISRPPSPSSNAGAPSKSKGAQLPALTPLQRLLADTTAVQAMLGTLGKPPQGGLALEAVDEAFDALEGFKRMIKYLVEEQCTSTLHGSRGLQEITAGLLEESEDVPALIALSVLVQLVPPAQLPRPASDITVDARLFASAESIISNEWRGITVAELIGISDAEYRTSCLIGFGRADAAVEPVGRAVLDALFACRPRSPPRTLSASTTSTFSTAASVCAHSLVSEKGLDLRVLKAWLAERIIANEDGAGPTLDEMAASGSDYYASVSISNSSGGNERRLA